MKKSIRAAAAAMLIPILLTLTGCSLTVDGVMSVIAPTETPVPGSDLVFSDAPEVTPEPRQIAYEKMDGVFSPFFAETDGDKAVAEMTQLSLRAVEGNRAPAEITRTTGTDGTVSVTIRLEKGLLCADGVELTADDLLFTYYVLMDESYDGPYTINQLPIDGIALYWNGMDSDMYGKYMMIYDEIYNGGKYESDLEKAVEDAKKNGEAVKAPVEVEASRDSNTAPTVKVELPKGAGETKVEIPVSNVKLGTVAVLVHPDGTEEIVKNSIPTEDGIRLTVDGTATVKIVDNSKGFIDTRNHWVKDAIDFVSARGLVNGMSDTIYAPNNSTTRAQLWTILARQNDANLNGGSVWYEKAQNWAKDKGVSDGANPNAAINRAQMVTMLWRAMGQPAAASGASFADVPADSYYAQAVAWAIENGITAGVGNGKFDPDAACTRGQIATFLYRYMK